MVVAKRQKRKGKKPLKKGTKEKKSSDRSGNL